MKIDGTSLSPVGSIQAATRVSQVNKKPVEMGQDKVAVSDKGQLFKALLDKAKDMQDVENPERLEKLREAIANGSYKINANKIAAKMLE
ncbi:MAG: flagellar biosynthesis anti-sigma factor FlgM [Desulfitobacteriaceae bacterium]